MKGLLIKDMKLILKNKRFIVCVALVVVIMIMAKNDNAAFLIGYTTMVCSLLATSTISMDTADKSISYLMTMPIARNTYVAEKYLLMALGSLSGCLIAAAASIALQPEKYVEILLQTAAVFAALFLAQLIMMPIHLKYGRDRGLIVLMLIYVAALLFFQSISTINRSRVWIGMMAAIDAAGKWFRSLEVWSLCMAACVFLFLCLAVSYRVSSGIIRKLEF